MKDSESRLKLAIPNCGEIEIEGKTGFVEKFFKLISYEFETELGKELKNFKGNLEMIETRRGNTTEIQINEKEKGK